MTHILEISLTSLIVCAILIGSAFFGYKMINWGFATQSIWKIILTWGSWLLISLLLAFITGSINQLLPTLPLKEIFGIIFGIGWAALLIAAAIYTWCKPPYTTGLVILRIIWSYFALGSAAWAFLMVCMISAQK